MLLARSLEREHCESHERREQRTSATRSPTRLVSGSPSATRRSASGLRLLPSRPQLQARRARALLGHPMSEYEHIADPYAHHKSLAQLADNVGLLRNGPSPVGLASPNLHTLVDAYQTTPAGAAGGASPSAAAPSFSLTYAFFSVVLVLLVLQTLVWLAQKAYAQSMHARRFEKGGGAFLQNFAFLSAAAPTFARYGTAFGFILGVLTMAIVQWLCSPQTVAHTLGTSHAADIGAQFRSDTPASATPPTVQNFAACPPPPVCESTVCPECRSCPSCPTCPADKAVAIAPQVDCRAYAAKVLAEKGGGECTRINDLRAHEQPLYFQSTYTSVPLYPIKCDWEQGKWIDRAGPLPRWFTDVDRWNMFGPAAEAKDMGYTFRPPASCDGIFRPFDATKFLRALEGKTIAFLGDSMNRQLHGMLTSLLYQEVIGHTLYYHQVGFCGWAEWPGKAKGAATASVCQLADLTTSFGHCPVRSSPLLPSLLSTLATWTRSASGTSPTT